MSKVWVAGVAAILVLAVGAIAVAQTAVTNTYDVDGTTTPRAKGTKRKPVPIGVNFDLTVGEAQNRRPAPVKSYSIRFGGTQVNTAVARACSTTALDRSGPEGCPAGSILGKGFIENRAGGRDNPDDQSLACNVSLHVINGGDLKAHLYVRGHPNSGDPRAECAIDIGATIPGQFVKRGNATALEFEVPDSLLHPLPTLSNAVRRATAKVPRRTKRIRGRTRGYFEAIGGCTGGSRTITVVFTTEDGRSTTAQSKARC